MKACRSTDKLRSSLITGVTFAGALLFAGALSAQEQAQDSAAPLLSTYIPLTDDSNALLWQTAEPSANRRIVAINIHADNLNSFEYYTGMELAKRGYRAININYYGPEVSFEEFLEPIAAAVTYARSLPDVEAVIFATHSGGGPMLAYYQEIAENGPGVCQEPNRIAPCDPEGLEALPPVDALLFLSVNSGAPHRLLALDPAVENGRPRARDPKLDLYLPENGYDAATNTATYSPAFVKLYDLAVHNRMEGLIDTALTRLRLIESDLGPYRDDEPFVVDGLAEGTFGARLYIADGALMSRTRGAYKHLKADGSSPVEVVSSTRPPAGTAPKDRDLLSGTSRNHTLRHFLSFLALRTTPDFGITADNVTGVDWRSSANSAPGNVQKVTIPTLVMGGSCVVHHVVNEIIFENSAAQDKEFVVVEGANHQLNPCNPEFGDTRTRAFDYVEAWLNARF